MLAITVNGVDPARPPRSLPCGHVNLHRGRRPPRHDGRAPSTITVPSRSVPSDLAGPAVLTGDITLTSEPSQLGMRANRCRSKTTTASLRPEGCCRPGGPFYPIPITPTAVRASSIVARPSAHLPRRVLGLRGRRPVLRLWSGGALRTPARSSDHRRHRDLNDPDLGLRRRPPPSAGQITRPSSASRACPLAPGTFVTLFVRLAADAGVGDRVLLPQVRRVAWYRRDHANRPPTQPPLPWVAAALFAPLSRSCRALVAAGPRPTIGWPSAPLGVGRPRWGRGLFRFSR